VPAGIANTAFELLQRDKNASIFASRRVRTLTLTAIAHRRQRRHRAQHATQHHWLKRCARIPPSVQKCRWNMDFSRLHSIASQRRITSSHKPSALRTRRRAGALSMSKEL
jgi:hypothetical protein